MGKWLTFMIFFNFQNNTESRSIGFSVDSSESLCSRTYIVSVSGGAKIATGQSGSRIHDFYKNSTLPILPVFISTVYLTVDVDEFVRIP